MPNKIIQVFDLTPEELQEKISDDLRNELKLLAQNLQPKNEEEFSAEGFFATD